MKTLKEQIAHLRHVEIKTRLALRTLTELVELQARHDDDFGQANLEFSFGLAALLAMVGESLEVQADQLETLEQAVTAPTA